MTDRLSDLLHAHPVLFGVLCRDATATELELMRAAGYDAVWFDLEHGGQGMSGVIALARTARLLGLASFVRVPDLAKASVQPLLDAGVDALILPDIEGAAQARSFVRLCRFPPLGRRGASSSTPWVDYAGASDAAKRIAAGDDGVHLAVQFESEEAFREIDDILAVDGIDMVTVGPLDWRVRAPRDVASVGEHVETVLRRTVKSGKVAVVAVEDPAIAARYRAAGARIVFVGIDVGLRRQMYADALARFRSAGA